MIKPMILHVYPYQIMTVDPGLIGTGVAIWRSTEKTMLPVDRKSVCPIICTSHIARQSKHKDDWVSRSKQIGMDLAGLIKHYDVTAMFVEKPQFFPSEGGQVVASSDSLIKLTFLTGVFAMAAWFADIPFGFVGVPEWKGQLKDEVVRVRCMRLTSGMENEIEDVSHVWAAIGIGLFLQGKF